MIGQLPCSYQTLAYLLTRLPEIIWLKKKKKKHGELGKENSLNFKFNSLVDSYEFIGHKKTGSYGSECAADISTEADTAVHSWHRCFSFIFASSQSGFRRRLLTAVAHRKIMYWH